MKPYKTKEMNDKVRETVRKANEYFNTHLSVGRKYLSNDEFTLDICHICNVTYSIAKRATWFIRSNYERDQKALKEWGFNRYTAWIPIKPNFIL